MLCEPRCVALRCYTEELGGKLPLWWEERICWEELGSLFSLDTDCTEDRSWGTVQTLPQHAVAGLGMASPLGGLEAFSNSRSWPALSF